MPQDGSLRASGPWPSRPGFNAASAPARLRQVVGELELRSAWALEGKAGVGAVLRSSVCGVAYPIRGRSVCYPSGIEGGWCESPGANWCSALNWVGMPVKVTGTFLHKRWWLAAAAMAMVVSLSGSVATEVSASSSSGGTVTFAEQPGSTPTYIFPLEDGANSGNDNITYLQPLMWRPLYWFGHSNSNLPTINYSLSLAKPPVWSDGGRTVTINLLHYLWSNGSPVTLMSVSHLTEATAYQPGTTSRSGYPCRAGSGSPFIV